MNHRPKEAMDCGDVKERRVAHITANLAHGHFCKGDASNLLAASPQVFSPRYVQMCKRLDKRGCLAGTGSRDHDETSCRRLVKTRSQRNIGFGIGTPNARGHASTSSTPSSNVGGNFSVRGTTCASSHFKPSSM